MSAVSRNEAIEIARRTQRNLEHIKREFDRKGEDSNVHVVTQLVNSLLGMVVLPREKYLEVRNDATNWKCLVEQDYWPEWHITKGTAKTLGELIRHIRNAAAHGRITYSSDSRYLDQVTITVEDSKDDGKSIYWSAKIRGDKLYDFCMSFSAHVEETID